MLGLCVSETLHLDFHVLVLRPEFGLGLVDVILDRFDLCLELHDLVLLGLEGLFQGRYLLFLGDDLVLKHLRTAFFQLENNDAGGLLLDLPLELELVLLENVDPLVLLQDLAFSGRKLFSDFREIRGLLLNLEELRFPDIDFFLAFFELICQPLNLRAQQRHLMLQGLIMIRLLLIQIQILGFPHIDLLIEIPELLVVDLVFRFVHLVLGPEYQLMEG